MLQALIQFFNEWNKSPAICKLSSQCMEDMLSYLHGVIALHDKVSQRADGILVPARINSDAVENFFCQQRGVRNGLNSNPNYSTYSTSTNTIILTQDQNSSTFVCTIHFINNFDTANTCKTQR